MLTIKLSRDEVMACIVALQKYKPYGWRDDALDKLTKSMGLKRIHAGLKEKK